MALPLLQSRKKDKPIIRLWYVTVVASFLHVDDLERLYKSKPYWFQKLLNNSIDEPFETIKNKGFWWADSLRFADYGLMIVTDQFVSSKLSENNFYLKNKYKTSDNSQTYYIFEKN